MAIITMGRERAGRAVCIITSVVIDRFGARKTFVASWIFYHSDVTHQAQLFLTYGTAGFFVGIMCGVPFVMVHAFLAPVQFSGISFSYNIAYAIFGGLTPMGIALPGNAKSTLLSTARAKAPL